MKLRYFVLQCLPERQTQRVHLPTYVRSRSKRKTRGSRVTRDFSKASINTSQVQSLSIEPVSDVPLSQGSKPFLLIDRRLCIQSLHMSNGNSDTVQAPQSRYLADVSGIPILSSTPDSLSDAQRRDASTALSSLTNTYLAAYELASRFDLGVLTGISVETEGGISMRQNFVEAPPSEHHRKSNGDHTPNDSSLGRRFRLPERREEEAQSAVDDQSPPSLVATVVAPSNQMPEEIRRAERELEAIGRAFQRAWKRVPTSRTGSEGGSSGYSDDP